MSVWISSFKSGYKDRPGSITVNRKKYKHDVIVTWKGKVKVAQLSKRNIFSKREFMRLLFERPEAIVIGLGKKPCVKIELEVIEFAEEKNIEIIDRSTIVAVKEFNQIAKEGKKVVAYMHVMC